MCHHIKVYGPIVDNETRCTHYHSALDIIAIKFKCCGKYYPCFKCHNENEQHSIVKWSKNERDHKAILCGVCKNEMTIKTYMSVNHCPHCNSPFNENCSFHYHYYFET